MKIFFAFLMLLCCSIFSFGQQINKIIHTAEVKRIEEKLASDNMQGRKTFTAGIEKAAAFIVSEFKKNKLQYFPGLDNFQQSFSLLKAELISAVGSIDSIEIDKEKIIAITSKDQLIFNETSGYTRIVIDSATKLSEEASRLLKYKRNYLVLVDSAHAKDFPKLKRFKRDNFKSNSSVVFVLSSATARTYNFKINHKITESGLSNIVGYIPGKSKPEEFVIFSAHYDHLGIGKPDANMDSIYNGANDDAAGTTAVIMLSEYFSKLNNNERSIIFVAFTAEEIGGFGSRYFSTQINPEKVVAMFNIEMIGTASKWGKNSAYITGYEKSDFGKILQKNLQNSNFRFEPDPYPEQKLFYRSDNATLAKLGVPAHTISTSKMDVEKYYHTQDDEIEMLDLPNMTEIIKAIAISSSTIINGKDSPSRVEE